MAEVSEKERLKMNAMLVSMLTLRPNMELWRAHRQELTDPWVGPGAKRHKDMITKTVNDLIDNWINKDEVEFVNLNCKNSFNDFSINKELIWIDGVSSEHMDFLCDSFYDLTQKYHN